MESGNDGSRHGCGNWACRGHGGREHGTARSGAHAPPCGPSGARVRLRRGRARHAGANSGWASTPAGRQADEAKGRGHATQQGGPIHLPHDHRGTGPRCLPTRRRPPRPGPRFPLISSASPSARPVWPRSGRGGGQVARPRLWNGSQGRAKRASLRQAGLATASGFSPPGSVTAFGGGDTRRESALGGYPSQAPRRPLRPPS